MRVPTVEQRGINPGYIDVNVNANQFGASAAAGVAQAAETVGNISGDIARTQDKQKVLSIVSNAQDFYNKSTTEYQSRLVSDANGV